MRAPVESPGVSRASPPEGSSASRGGGWLRSRKRLFVALASALALLLALHVARDGAASGSYEASLATVMARSGVRVDPTSVVWVDDHAHLHAESAFFLADEGGGATDVYAAAVRRGADGAVLDVSDVANLTRSSGAAEEQLARHGDHVVFTTRSAAGVEAFTLVDTRGEPAEATSGWSWLARLQNTITNWQETGRVGGLGVTRFQLLEPVPSLPLRGDEREVRAGEGEAEIVVSLDTLEVTRLAERVEAHPDERGVPGGITWVVDTVRGLSFVGPEPIEWLESRVFAIQDWWDRTRYAHLGGTSEAEAAATAAAEMSSTLETDHVSEEQRQLFDAAAAEIGFPPPPIASVFETPIEGEGQWVPIIDDPFVNAYPNAPAAFAQTFVRADRERPYVNVFITLWDPRQVQLRIMPGTREPESATGQRGSGYIPRDERTTRMLVGAFDGGFQALHGEFGMMSDGRVYLPPKPWAATIAVMADGRVGMGSWPAPNWRGSFYDENLANRQIPEGMVDMRQNLTSVVEDGRYNPWERWWWGAAPPGATEQTFTHRSGVCLTEEGFMAFFWGGSLGPEALGQAMIAARCVRAMHLDMNSGHCGFEFFRPYATSADPRDLALPEVPRIDADAEYDGAFPGAHGLRLRARKAVRSMQMRFPRYTARDPRDFFYLTLRPTLPGPALAGGLALSTEGLPHAGWPYAFARASRGANWLVRVDPSRAIPSALAGARHTRVLARLAGMSGGTHAIVARREAVGVSFVLEPRGGDGIEIVRGPLADERASAAIGVDRDGFFVYAEGPEATALLRDAGVSSAIALGAASLAFETGEGGAGPDGHRRSVEGGVTLLAEEAAATEILFPDVTPMPYSRWSYLQGQRVRYFPSQPPRFVRPTE